MKKRIRGFLISLIATLAFTVSVDAASGSISVSSGTKTAVVGSTFTVTVKVNCSEAIGSWQYGLTYDSAYVSLQSGDTNVAGYGDGSIKSKTYTYKFKAIKSGKAGIRISAPSMVSWNDVNSLFTPSISNATVTIKTQAEIEASYSKDNNLKSLSVEGYEISPAFSADTLEYTVSVPDTETQINVQASTSDRAARVSGTGIQDISEGTNKISIVVTAENGSTKTYTLTVDVKDLDPINVTVMGEDYTVVKKADLIKEPIGFASATVTIDGKEVPAFKSEVTGFTIVGLKNSKGEIGLFLYDEDEKSYKKYDELRGASLTLYPLKIENVLDNFSKIELKTDDVEYEALRSDFDENFYVIYAMNMETGDKGYYQYDKELNSYIKYNENAYKKLSTSNSELKLYMIAASVIAGVFFLLTITLKMKVSKLKKIIRKFSQTKLSDKGEKTRRSHNTEEEVDEE